MNTKSILIGLILLISGIAGGWYLANMNKFSQKNIEEKQTILLEQIKKVTKLSTVEGKLTEIYSYTDYKNYDWSFLRKQALIRVTATVAVGYDFEKLAFEIDHKKKSITITNIPRAEILSIDHELDYYDIKEGVFNSFSTDDYNRINKNAKEYIRSVAQNSALMKTAEQNKDELLGMLGLIAQGMGYELNIVNTESQNLQG